MHALRRIWHVTKWTIAAAILVPFAAGLTYAYLEALANPGARPTAPAEPETDAATGQPAELVRQARGICIEGMRRAAHDPSSLRVPLREEWYIERRGELWSLATTVRSANIYGATVRQDVVCVAKKQGRTWHLLEFQTR